MYAIMWSQYLGYSKNAVEHTCAHGKYICSGTYASNVECVYSSAPGCIVDCSEFMRHLY